MKTRKGTFIQRKNRTKGVSKFKTETEAKKWLGIDELVWDNSLKGYKPETLNDNGGWYKTAEMIHYCEYGAFGEGDYMEFQNLYSPNNPFKEIDEIIDNR